MLLSTSSYFMQRRVGNTRDYRDQLVGREVWPYHFTQRKEEQYFSQSYPDPSSYSLTLLASAKRQNRKKSKDTKRKTCTGRCEPEIARFEPYCRVKRILKVTDCFRTFWINLWNGCRVERGGRMNKHMARQGYRWQGDMTEIEI